MSPTSNPPEHDPGQGVIIGIGRVDLLRRVGALLRGDWSMFDGRDCQRWIDDAIDGDADTLRAIDEELHELEAE